MSCSLNDILSHIKNISISCFFLTLSYTTFEIMTCIKNIESDIITSTSLIRREIPTTRENLFSTLNTSLDKIHYRISSVETNLFKRVDTIEKKTFHELEKTNNDVHLITLSVDSIAKEYNKVPGELFKITKSLEPNYNCEINDYCWPNLFSDLLIDSRNMVRDGSKSFNLFNREVPKFTTDINKVSTSLAIEIPKVTENTSKITDNINRLTKPKWYDRLLGIGANTSMIYFNINRTIR